MAKTRPTNMRLGDSIIKAIDRLAPKLGVKTRSDVVRIAVIRLEEEENARIARLKNELVHHSRKR